jgi:hypothetical protein
MINQTSPNNKLINKKDMKKENILKITTEELFENLTFEEFLDF